MRPLTTTFTLLITLALLAPSAEAQELDWLHRMSASFFSFGNATHVDSDGNVYVTGYAGGSLDVGGTTINGAGLGDLFIAKYNSQRSLQWVKAGTSEGWNGGRDIGVGPNGGVWVVGRIEGTTMFDGVSVGAVGENDAVIARYSAAGEVIWAKSGGGVGMDWANSVIVDASGNSVMVGYINGTATFGGRTLRGRGGGNDIFVAAYDPDGNLLWASTAGGIGTNEAYGVDVDADGNVYVAGIISGSARFDGLPVAGEANGTGFIAKYGTDGIVDWVKTMQGASSAESVSVNDEGEVFVAGSFSGTITAGDVTLASAGGADIFVVQYDSEGSSSTGFRYGGKGDDGVAGFGKGVEIVADDDGSFTIGSSFSGTLASGLFSLESQGAADIFVGRFGADGDGLWGIAGGGTEADHYVSVGVDAAGDAYFLGNYFSPVFRMDGITVTRRRSVDMVMGKVEAPLAPGQPVIELSRSSLAIGDVVTGQSKDRTLTMGPGNDVPLEVTDITMTGNDAFTLVLRDPAGDPVTLPTTLTGGMSITLEATFVPSAPGEATAEITITTNDPATSIATVAVSGNGLDGNLIPVAVVSTEDLDIGTVVLGEKQQGSFTIEPGTAAGLQVGGIEFEDPASAADGFTIVEPTSFPVDVVAGGSLDVIVEFVPTDVGSATARVAITTNDASRPFRSVDVTARGSEPPFAVISASDIDFGEVNIGESGGRSLTVSAGSDGALMIENITLTPDGTTGYRLLAPSDNTTYPIEVKQGTPTMITVSFAPLAEAQELGILTIETNDPTRQKVDIPLVGSGKLTLSVADDLGLSGDASISITPHPLSSNGLLALDFKDHAEIHIDLLDVRGTVVAALFAGRVDGSKEIAIDVSTLPAGLYFTRITTDGAQVTRPLVIAR